ncbi:MAG: acetyl-CoA carboxylase carboxyltransferase subunit beta [Actinobacteria bacterium]|nr:acetyl-CoA carboxylase carboxyltransferase subunit beta [Actinomycetota bacterium]
MSIGDWFKARESQKYTVSQRSVGTADVPDGVWSKCVECKRIIYQGELIKNLYVCRHCGYHVELTAVQKINMLVDAESFSEIDAGLTAADPLAFTAVKSYEDSITSAKVATGLPEAIITGRASINGYPTVLGAMDFRFIGASMGSVVGEKVARAFELASVEGRAVVLATASGGARMQEGMLSLMQMAKTAAAIERFSREGLPYIAVLTHPTMGGVTASFAGLADVTYAEPGALVGFAGPRVIEQSIRQKLPKGFQRSEFLLRHGMIDGVVPRSELRDRVALTLGYLMHSRCGGSIGADAGKADAAKSGATATKGGEA